MTMIPPMMFRIGIGKTTRGVRLPLFLLWPFVIPVFAFLFFLILVVWLVGNVLRREWPSPFVVLRLWQMLCAAKGLLIEVRDKEDNVIIELS